MTERQRETETEKDTDRQTDRQTETVRQTDRQTDRERQRVTEKQREKQTHRVCGGENEYDEHCPHYEMSEKKNETVNKTVKKQTKTWFHSRHYQFISTSCTLTIMAIASQNQNTSKSDPAYLLGYDSHAQVCSRLVHDW